MQERLIGVLQRQVGSSAKLVGLALGQLLVRQHHKNASGRRAGKGRARVGKRGIAV